MKRFAILVVLVSLVTLAATPCQAGLFDRFNAAMAKLLNDYTNDNVAAGKAVKDGWKAGSLTNILNGWTQAEVAAGKNATANLKELGKSLLDFVFFIPRLIEKAFKAVAEVIGNILDAITGGPPAGNPPPAQAPGNSFAPKASDTAAGGDFLSTFEAEPDLAKRLATYVRVASEVRNLNKTVGTYLAKDDRAIAAEEGVKAEDVAKGKEECKSKTALTASLVETMEQSLARDIAASDEALKVYEGFRKTVDAGIRYSVMPSLNLKVLELRK